MIRTARAHPNLALIKYWGKRDEELILPAAGSLSLTLDQYPTTTTVETHTGEDDSFSLNEAEMSGVAQTRVTRFLDRVRELAGSQLRARVTSINEAPTAAGLASSASGFAALATAASAAYGLNLDARELSRLARRGSGSACRSICTGIAVWHAGQDDETSFAEQISAPDLSMVIVTIDAREKAVSSRVAMRETARTSPYYADWVRSTESTLDNMIIACESGDVQRIGELTELNALRMHAAILASDPPIRFMQPRSFEVFDRVAELRKRGVFAWATADAGPNVAVLTLPAEAEHLAEALREYGETRVAHAGRGAYLIESPMSGAIE